MAVTSRKPVDEGDDFCDGLIEVHGDGLTGLGGRDRGRGRAGGFPRDVVSEAFALIRSATRRTPLASTMGAGCSSGSWRRATARWVGFVTTTVAPRDLLEHAAAGELLHQAAEAGLHQRVAFTAPQFLSEILVRHAQALLVQVALEEIIHRGDQEHRAGDAHQQRPDDARDLAHGLQAAGRGEGGQERQLGMQVVIGHQGEQSELQQGLDELTEAAHGEQPLHPLQRVDAVEVGDDGGGGEEEAGLE